MNPALCIDCGQPKARPRSDTLRCRSCAKRRDHAAGVMPLQQRRRVEVVCALCGSTFEVAVSRQETARVCGRACAAEAKRRVRGADHPLSRERVTMACEVCGRTRDVKPSLVRRFRSCSRECNGVLATLAMPRVSSIERATAAYLTERGVSFRQQVRIGRFVADFVIGDLAVEVDGTYWHSLPQVVERDGRKDIAYAAAGYRVVHLAETDIKANNFAALDVALEVAA